MDVSAAQKTKIQVPNFNGKAFLSGFKQGGENQSVQILARRLLKNIAEDKKTAEKLENFVNHSVTPNSPMELSTLTKSSRSMKSCLEASVSPKDTANLHKPIRIADLQQMQTPSKQASKACVEKTPQERHKLKVSATLKPLDSYSNLGEALKGRNLFPVKVISKKGIYRPKDTKQFNRDFETALKGATDLELLRTKWLQKLYVLSLRKTGTLDLSGAYMDSKELIVSKIKERKREGKISELLSRYPEIKALSVNSSAFETLMEKNATLINSIAVKVEKGFKVPDFFYKEMLALIEDPELRSQWTLTYFIQHAYKFSTMNWMETYSTKDKFVEGVDQIFAYLSEPHPFSKDDGKHGAERVGAIGLAYCELAYKIETANPDLSCDEITTKVMKQTPIAFFFENRSDLFTPKVFKATLLRKLQDPLKR